MSFVVGLDLGQSNDYTAVAVVESDDAVNPRTYQLRHLDRWRGLPYPQIVEKVRLILKALPTGPQLAVDQTGVGAAVIDLLRAARLRANLIPILIHGGDKATLDPAGWRVPKRDLVGVVSVLLETSRFRIAARLPQAKTLLHEFRSFRVTIDPATAHDSYSAWREKDHDDLVLSAALALYVAESGPHWCNPMCAKCRESWAIVHRWQEENRSPFATPDHLRRGWTEPGPRYGGGY